MSPFRAALIVPDYSHSWNDDGQFHLSELTQLCHGGQVDLAIFPEAYEKVDGGVEEIVADWAATLRIPVLMGIEYQGFQLAVYRNPAPRRGETKSHLYVKHSTSQRLAYEWPGYRGIDDPMFQPINIRGKKLGVELCHDMYYGLVAHRLKANGTEVFVDLTGGNVNMPKWKNIVRARSLERGGSFLCTMGWSSGSNGSAAALAYRAGQSLGATADTTNAEGFGGFAVFDLDGPIKSEFLGEGQAYTDKKYKDITISLGRDRPADIVARLSDSSVVITGPGLVTPQGHWRGFKTKAGAVGLLPLPLSSLSDAVVIHRRDAPRGEFDHLFVLYYADSAPASLADTLTLMKLRAIEHRMGVALLAGTCREVLKTNRYKNIQRFVEQEGVFGVNTEFLGGTWSTAGVSSGLGIPFEYFDAYRSLLQ